MISAATLYGVDTDIASDAGAVISEDGLYRYGLWRRWDSDYEHRNRTAAVFIMLNPSTADASKDDPTIRKCRGFAQRWGCGGLVVVNLYAWRATEPKMLYATRDPIGPENDAALIAAFQLAASHGSTPVAAWGSFKGPNIERRIRDVQQLATDHGVKLHAIKLSVSGKPWHPLYVPYESELVVLK